MSEVIRNRVIRWDLVTPEQKKPLWMAADMAQAAAKAIKDQIKADLNVDPFSCPGLTKKKDGTARKITDTTAAFGALLDVSLDHEVLECDFMALSSISLENFSEIYRKLTGATDEEVDRFIADKCSHFIETKPRSGSVKVEK